jgi:aldehyde:ferredoxin oxidoreductase
VHRTLSSLIHPHTCSESVCGTINLTTIVELTTGLKLDEKELRKISSNIQNETRRFNLREGITAKDDTLPKRFFDEPLGKDEKAIRRKDLQKMLQDYYALRGWTSEGIPESSF